jgi:hypothetical protein
MTNNFNTYWSGTARPAKKIGPKNWKSEVWLVRRDTFEPVKTLESFGATEISAMTNGLKQAKHEAEEMGAPSDWKTRKAPPGSVIL